MKKNRILEFLEKYYKVFILILFVTLAFIVGVRHEPWADEAQAWLLARDSSLYSLIIKNLHFEGHPALWYIILKFVQFLGMPYKYLFILPIIFSSIGVYLFIFKSKFPWYIKCLFPFTFFVFYQYTIVARSYCLIFPLVVSLAIIWDDRYEKIGIFTLILILLINCEAHTYLFAGSIYFYCLLETFLDFRKGIKKEKKVYVGFIILFLAFLMTLLYVFPTGTTHVPFQIISYSFSDSFLTSFFMNDIFKFIISLLIIIYFVLFILKDRKNILTFFLFIVPIIVFMVMVYFREWHLGIIMIIFIFYIWSNGYEKNKYVNIFLILICIVQIPWTIKSSIYDYKYLYSKTSDVADFIKKYDYNNLKIVNDEFYGIAINAYFDKNIFSNNEKGFFSFNEDSEYFSTVYNSDYVLNNDIDIYIVYSKNKEKNNIEKLIDYNEYIFNEGCIFFEGRKHKDLSFYVYVKKDIDEQKTKES